MKHIVALLCRVIALLSAVLEESAGDFCASTDGVAQVLGDVRQTLGTLQAVDLLAACTPDQAVEYERLVIYSR